MKYIKFISWWNGFDPLNNLYKKNLFTDYEIDSQKYQILCIGSFISEKDYHYILESTAKKILFITEPLSYMSQFKYTYLLYTSNHCDIVSGCIENNFDLNHLKFPLYMNYFNYKNPSFLSINQKVHSISSLDQKKFCCLVNRHDIGNTRTCLYLLLNTIEKIDCPSKLFNNMSNELLNQIGNIQFYEKYIFQLCPENFKCNTFKGYITEKLLLCCLGGAIPIYQGHFDMIDASIFNENRIIFYDPISIDSLLRTKSKINYLMNNPTELLSFYQQSIFKEDAYQQLRNLEDIFKQTINNNFYNNFNDNLHP